MSKPLVFDIKRYAIHDGPGIRIVVFLKGCNLNCTWCHNPEGISAESQRMYSSSRCIKCGTCVAVCPEKAISLTLEGIITDSGKCKMSGECAESCPAKALEFSGREISVEEILQEIEKERPFFDQSGGGVTFSGGEPLLSYNFLIRLLEECGKRGIHRAVDTAGFVTSDVMLKVAEHTDLFLYDLKIMDPEKHRKWTGISNERILENLKILADTGAKIIIRIPLIGGVNDDSENIEATARFVAGLSGEKKEVNLLPYHKIARTKYQKLGRPEDFQLMEEPSKESQLQAILIFHQFGIMATLGG